MRYLKNKLLKNFAAKNASLPCRSKPLFPRLLSPSAVAGERTLMKLLSLGPSSLRRRYSRSVPTPQSAQHQQI
jgi:hypothetical protein